MKAKRFLVLDKQKDSPYASPRKWYGFIETACRICIIDNHSTANIIWEETLKVKTCLVLMILIIASGCDQPTQEEKDWQIAKTEDTFEEYEKFLYQYPESVYTDSARELKTIIRYRKASSGNTISAYEDFLTIVPEGPLSDMAKSGIETILDDRHPAFKNVKTIKWSPKVLSSDGEFVIQKAFSITNRLFAPSGIILVKSDTVECDAQLKLNARGNALGGYYKAIHGKISGYHITGAIVNIQLRLSIPGSYSVKKSFNGQQPLSEFVSRVKKNRSDAPWMRAIIASGYSDGMVEILNDQLGKTGLINALFKQEIRNLKYHGLYKPLTKALERHGLSVNDLAIKALDDYNWKARKNGVEILKSLEDSASFQTLLTVLLEDKHEYVRREACNAFYDYAELCPNEVLLKALQDSHLEVRDQAGLILGRKKDYHTCEPIIALLRDENKGVRFSAVRALKLISGKTFKKKSRYHNFTFEEKRKYWERWWSFNKKSLLEK